MAATSKPVRKIAKKLNISHKEATKKAEEKEIAKGSSYPIVNPTHSVKKGKKIEKHLSQAIGKHKESGGKKGEHVMEVASSLMKVAPKTNKYLHRHLKRHATGYHKASKEDLSKAHAHMKAHGGQ